jgi:hypothetical protein
MQLSESVSCNTIFFVSQNSQITVGRGPETGNQLRVALCIVPNESSGLDAYNLTKTRRSQKVETK